MPHFVIDCSNDVFDVCSEDQFINEVYFVAVESGLFDPGDIKVRVQTFSKFTVGNKSESFIHIFASIMQGRTTEQKASLSKLMVNKLVTMFPNTQNIAMNISEFEKSTYCNRSML